MTHDDEPDWDNIREQHKVMRQVHGELAARRYVQILEKSGITPAWELMPFTVDTYGTMRLGRWGGWFIELVPMGFNDRVVLTPEHAPMVYDHGWCYDKGGLAFLGAIGWDPEQDAEPPGYKKRATPHPREAGERAQGLGNGLVYASAIEALVETLADTDSNGQEG